MSRLSYEVVKEEIEKLGGKWIGGEYKNNRSPLLLECNICKKEFTRNYSSIKDNKNTKCRKCTTKINKESGKCFVVKEETILKVNASLINIGAKWIGNKEEYVNNKSKLTLVCTDCNEVFEKRYDVLVNGKNPKCNRCTKKDNGYKNSQRNFKEIEDYAKENGSEVVKFVTGKSRVEIHLKCVTCGETFVNKSKTDVMSKKKLHCFKCSRLELVDTYKRHSIEYISNYVSNLGSKLLSCEYENSESVIDVECSCCGTKVQRTFSSIRRSGLIICEKCTDKLPSGELKIRDLLIKNDINFEMQKTFDDCKNKKKLKYDFYIPSLNTCIEFNGIQHYQPVDLFGGEEKFIQRQQYDKIKEQYCKDNHIPLLIIKYDVHDIEKQIEQFLKEISYED